MQGDIDMKWEYNKLTKKLLQEGYSAENHPDYVDVGRTCQSKENPLDNYNGGFEYKRWWIYEKTFKTPCGLQCKGTTCVTSLHYGNEEFTYENDMPTITCPYHKRECSKKHLALQSFGNDAIDTWCNVHLVDEEYHYEESVEALFKLRDDEIHREKVSFSLAHHGKTCDNHMYYDRKTEEWKLNYDPVKCGRSRCDGRWGKKTDESGKMICPILGRPLDKKRGNVFYDAKIIFERTDLRGTLFEGQEETQIMKGLRFLDHPVSMDICRNIVKLCKDQIIWHVEMKYHSELYFAKYHNQKFSVEVLNIRAEQRASRDLMQDLEDIKNGVKIAFYPDEEKERKEQKKQRILEAKEKRIKQKERKILNDGFSSLDDYEQNKMVKLIGEERINELENLRKKKVQEKVTQMDIFDFMGGEMNGSRRTDKKIQKNASP